MFLIDFAPPFALHKHTHIYKQCSTIDLYWIFSTLPCVTSFIICLNSQRKKQHTKKSLIVVFPFTVSWSFNLCRSVYVCVLCVHFTRSFFDVTILIPLNFSCSHSHSMHIWYATRERRHKKSKNMNERMEVMYRWKGGKSIEMDIEDKHTHGLRITSDKINLTIGISKQIAERVIDKKSWIILKWGKLFRDIVDMYWAKACALWSYGLLLISIRDGFGKGLSLTDFLVCSQ